MPTPSLMQAVLIDAPGAPEQLRVQETAVPQLKPDEVLIRVAAAGVNYPDVMQRLGLYDPPPWHSTIPGLEVAGEVAAIGADATGFTLGDRVVALTNGGGYAEYVAVPFGQVLPLPHGLGFDQGAALPETFFTVEQTLVLRAGLQPGMSVLVHGAAGGIGGAAIRIARALDALPIAVVSSAEKADYARELGAAEIIDHTREDFVARARELTGGKGVDRIISIAAGDELARNIAACGFAGTIIQLAVRGGGKTSFDAGALLGRQITIMGSTLRNQSSAVKASIADGLRRDIWPALAAGRIPPSKVRLMALADAPAAHHAMAQRSNFGKLVLVTRFGVEAGNYDIAPG